MSAQGGPARTKAASGNGQQPKKPAETEMFDAVEEGQDNTSPAQGRPMPAKEDNKPSPQPGPPGPPGPHGPSGPQGPPVPPQGAQPQSEGNETVRLRPSLATEAPPALELSNKKKGSGSSGGGCLARPTWSCAASSRGRP
ncbi:hypothetical protein ACFQ0B_11365 [Nonomuraea thailandensis]